MVKAHFLKNYLLANTSLSIGTQKLLNHRDVRELPVSQHYTEGNGDTGSEMTSPCAQLTGRNQQRPLVPRQRGPAAPTSVPTG